MRRRFRRSKSEEPPHTGAPAEPEPDHEAENEVVVGGDGADFDALLARQLERADATADGVDLGRDRVDLAPVDRPDVELDPAVARTVERDLEAGHEPGASAGPTGDLDLPASLAPETPLARLASSSPSSGGRPAAAEFWDLYDRAAAEAELAEVPPAAIIAIVGPLAAAAPVVDRCRARHWMGHCDVFVLTRHRAVPEHLDWIVVGQPSDLVSAIEDGGSDFPLLVLDVPNDLPAFVQPLVSRLREAGVGLVHYVLDDDPADEDLATWHGELGQPSVLDLAAPIEPSRVLELFDRGEPVVSVAGHELTTELLLAFRVEAGAEADPA